MEFSAKPQLKLLRVYILTVFLGIPLALAMLAFDRTLVPEAEVWVHILLCLGLAVIGGVLIHFFFWEKCFAKLYISDSGVFWKCPFRKTIYLSFSECNFVGIATEQTHKTPSLPFIYISRRPYPKDKVGKINNVHCSKDFIKFWYSKDLGLYLLSKDQKRFSCLLRETE